MASKTLWLFMMLSLVVSSCGGAGLLVDTEADVTITPSTASPVDDSIPSGEVSTPSTVRSAVFEPEPAHTAVPTVETHDTYGWEPTTVSPVAEHASVRLATGAAGWLLSVSVDSFQPPALWFSLDGEQWSRVAELPIERSSIGAPLVAVGANGLVAIKGGDPESAAFEGTSELAVWTSGDGRAWLEADPAGFEDAGYLYDMRPSEHGWVVAGEYVVDSHNVVPAVYWSADGRAWQRVVGGDQWGAARAVITGNRDVLVVGSEGGFPTVWRSRDGVRWSAVRLPAAGHGGEATAGAWIDGRWVVVGTGSETEPMVVWASADGSEWERLGGLVPETVSPWDNRFGSGGGFGEGLAVSSTRVRYAHENFCYETSECFVTTEALLFTPDGVNWSEIPLPPSDGEYTGLPDVRSAPSGDLIAATVFEGDLIVWKRASGGEATIFQQDPPVPELTIEQPFGVKISNQKLRMPGASEHTAGSFSSASSTVRSGN